MHRESSTVKKSYRSPWRLLPNRKFAISVSASFFAFLATAGVAEMPAPPNSVDQAPVIESQPNHTQSTKVRIAAHRGGYKNDKSDNAPENSVANIDNCQRQGFDIYETDIQRTRDGYFVIVHDATIDRETTGTGPASQLDLDDLKNLFKRFRDRTVSEHRVATLDEFLVAGKGRVVFKADLKPGVNQFFDEIMAIVVRHDAMDGIIFRVPYRDADLFADYRAKGVPITRDQLMFMVSDQKQVDDIRKRFDPSTIQVNVNKNNPTNPRTLRLIRYATHQGLLVETHAEGTEQDWQKLVHAGVRIFHTGQPAKMQAFLRRMALQEKKEDTPR
tara:strand:- start:70993 stop:71982 length:990 start_codon:yes stop_codon:yes gene_type:complete